MSYAVCRMAKMKSHSLKGMQIHNQREKESKTNPDIDKSKLSLNYDLANDEPINYNEKVKQIIDSQKTSTRKTRKDAVLVNELLVTSDRKFFDNLSSEEQKRFFEESYKLFSERYGQQNVAYATVHNDEKTPHMHLGIVPMRDGKLQGKNVFNQKELRWIQDEFPKHLQSKGFDIERGEKGSTAEHLKVQDFKAKTLEERIAGLETELGEKQKEKVHVEQSIEHIQNELGALQKASIHSKGVEGIEFKEKGLLGRKTVNLERSDFEELKSLAKVSESLQIKNDKLENKNVQLEKLNWNLRKKNDHLTRENTKLNKENKSLVQENKFLSRTLENVKVRFRDQVKDFHSKIGFIKANILDKMEMEIFKKYFGGQEELEGGQAFLALKKQQEKEKQNQKEKDDFEL